MDRGREDYVPGICPESSPKRDMKSPVIHSVNPCLWAGSSDIGPVQSRTAQPVCSYHRDMTGSDGDNSETHKIRHDTVFLNLGYEFDNHSLKRQ